MQAEALAEQDFAEAVRLRDLAHDCAADVCRLKERLRAALDARP
jgi:hypothetical protein